MEDQPTPQPNGPCYPVGGGCVAGVQKGPQAHNDARLVPQLMLIDDDTEFLGLENLEG